MENHQIKNEPFDPLLESVNSRDSPADQSLDQLSYRQFLAINPGNQPSTTTEMSEAEKIHYVHDSATSATYKITQPTASDHELESIPCILHSSSAMKELNTCNSCKKEIDGLKLLIQQQQEAQIQMHKALMEQISKLQKKLDTVLVKSNDSSLHLLPRFPLMSKEAVAKIEEDLNNDAEMVNQMKNYFKRIGGEDVTAFVRSCLRSFLTDSVAENFCWLGTKEKESVRLLSIIMILKSACYERFPASTESSIERVIKNHFTYAHDRLQKKKRAVKDIK